MLRIRGFVLVLLVTVLAGADALACRGYRNWSGGHNLAMLKLGEIVIKASLIDMYAGEKEIRSIMGYPRAAIYQLRVSEVVGYAYELARRSSIVPGAEIYARAPASVCEQYRPRDFSSETEKVLVLKKDEAGIFALVGGQDD